jgi:hypothetical protein
VLLPLVLQELERPHLAVQMMEVQYRLLELVYQTLYIYLPLYFATGREDSGR